MTNRDVFLTILSEATGKPRETFAAALETAKVLAPGHKFDEQLSDAEAQRLLAELRKEKRGIVSWLIEGGMKASADLRMAAAPIPVKSACIL